MRFTIFVLGLAGCSLTLPAFATPPIPAADAAPGTTDRSEAPASLPQLTVAPILAQMGGSPGLPMGASQNFSAGRAPSASMLPSSPSYSRRGSIGSSSIPSYRYGNTVTRSYRYPNVDRRPDYRPPPTWPGYGRPDYGRPGYRPDYGRPGYRPGYGRPGYPSYLPYYGHLHYHWRPTCWTRPYYPVYYNYGYSSVSGSWLSIGGTTVSFVNPFYVRPATGIRVFYDYSQPIRVPGPNYQETRDDLIRSERAVNRFDDARELFRRGEYGRASESIDEAIRLLPNDPTLHQFRALVLFARQRYQEAAAVIYSVLAVSPGWDSVTLQKLYDSPRTYLGQIRELEQYVRARPTAVEAKFLLAYHLASNGNLAGAQRLLDEVLDARPGDRVVQSLLTAIRG